MSSLSLHCWRGWWHGGNGWLAKYDGCMMVVSNTLLGNQNTSQKSQSLPFPLVAGPSNGCFCMVQRPWFLVSRTLPMLCTITYLTRWKERGTIMFIPELVHNLASALALRAPLSPQSAGKSCKRCSRNSLHFQSYWLLITKLQWEFPEHVIVIYASIISLNWNYCIYVDLGLR